MRCPKCNHHLLQKSGARTKVRTQGPLVFNGKEGCSTRCYWCGEPVIIPIELKKGIDIKGKRYIISHPESAKH